MWEMIGQRVPFAHAVLPEKKRIHVDVGAYPRASAAMSMLPLGTGIEYWPVELEVTDGRSSTPSTRAVTRAPAIRADVESSRTVPLIHALTGFGFREMLYQSTSPGPR